MSTVVSMRARKSSRNVLEVIDPNFLLAVGVSLIAPEVIASIYFGSLLAILLGICALLAMALGVASYRWNPERFISIVPMDDQQTTPAEEDSFKLAA